MSSEGYGKNASYYGYTDNDVGYSPQLKPKPKPNSIRPLQQNKTVINPTDFFKWLYDSSQLSTDINNYIRYAESICIPEFLIIIKYIKHLQIMGMTNQSELINRISHDIFGLLYTEQDLINMIEYASNIKHNDHNDDIVRSHHYFTLVGT
mgnify:CR=1 FL=1